MLRIPTSPVFACSPRRSEFRSPVNGLLERQETRDCERCNAHEMRWGGDARAAWRELSSERSHICSRGVTMERSSLLERCRELQRNNFNYVGRSHPSIEHFHEIIYIESRFFCQ